MAVAAMQDADRHIRSSLGFSILPKDALRCRQGESNQRPSLNKLLALPLSHNRPPFFASGGRFFNLRRSGHWTQMCKAPTAYRLQQKTNRIRLPFTSLIGPRCHAPSFSDLLVSGRTTEGDARTWFLSFRSCGLSSWPSAMMVIHVGTEYRLNQYCRYSAEQLWYV